MSCQKAIGTITAVGSPLSLETYWISASGIDYSVLRFSGRRREVRVTRDTKPRGRMAGPGGPAGAGGARPARGGQAGGGEGGGGGPRAGTGASAPQLRRYSSMESSAHPGSVAGRLFRNTMRRVLGKGRLVDNARL